MRKLQSYVAKYGPEVGPKFYHLLQSQAAHAGVSARLRRKIAEMNGRPAVAVATAAGHANVLPLFPEADAADVDRDEDRACPIAETSAVG